MPTVLRRLWYLLRRSRHDADLREEIETHRVLRQAHLERHGLPAGEAGPASHRALGNVVLAREDVRAVWVAPWLESVWQDVRCSIRAFRRRPAMWLVAMLSLALGIGVNAAAFFLFDRLVLRPLPIAEPEAVVNILATGPRPGARETHRAGGVDAIFSLPLVRDLEALGDVGLAGIAASGEFTANYLYGGRSGAGDGRLVSGGYFAVLGVRPAVGRLIGRSDDDAGAMPVVALTHAFWTSTLGGDPTVVGSTLVVNGHPLTIVGVAAPGFGDTTSLGAPPDFYAPLSLAGPMRGDARDRRDAHWLYLSGRLAPDTTREHAETLINTAFAAITRDIEAPALRHNMSDAVHEQFLARTIVLEDGSRGRGTERGVVRLALVPLSAVAVCVLLIVCANVANLLLARAADRRGEIALRLALGAAPGRLMRWLLTEACLLGVGAGVGGLAALAVTIEIVLTMVPAGPLSADFGLSSTVAVFALMLGGLAGVLLGLFPALHSVRSARGASLQAGSRASSPRAVTRYRTALATTQMALATALLALAGLFAVSLSHVARVDLGFTSSRLVAFGVSPALSGYSRDQAYALYGRLTEALSSLPAVRAVSTTTLPLLVGANWGQNLTVEGVDAGPQSDMQSSRAAVGPGYFRTIGVPLIAGRDFTDADKADAPRVAIVNEAFVRKFQLGSDVIGRRMALGAGSTVELDIEIVGLVGDSAYSSIREPPPPQFYMPWHQDDGGAPTMMFYVRTESEATSLLTAIGPTVEAVDPNLPVVGLRTMEDQVRRSTAQDRLLAVLSATVAALATALAGLGLYSVIAHTVANRWREIGIRMALGATAGEIRRSIGMQVGRIAGAGLLVGGGAGVALARLGESFFFGLDGRQPGVIAVAGAVAVLVAGVAAFAPARRAGRVNPADVLRSE